MDIKVLIVGATGYVQATDADPWQIHRNTIRAIARTMAGTENSFLYVSGAWVYGDTEEFVDQPRADGSPHGSESAATSMLGPFGDCLILDQRISTRAKRDLGWRPLSPNLIEELERGSYLTTQLAS